MGGFFGLLEDGDITIIEFWLIDPAHYLTQDDIRDYRTQEDAMDAVRQIFNKPNNDSQNLIDMLHERGNINVKTVISGDTHSILPLKVVGPTKDYYLEVVKDMVDDYGVKTYEESDTSLYDEAAQCNGSGVINEDDDPSPYNASSIIILYEPGDGRKVLFTGDATCASLKQMLIDYPGIKNISMLKVPHHGSKHNLNSNIINTLKPQESYISAKGTSKHPNVAIVNALSKHGDVFSTHKCTGFVHSANGVRRANTKSLEPLKRKQS
jgi:hypothetical protein